MRFFMANAVKNGFEIGHEMANLPTLADTRARTKSIFTTSALWHLCCLGPLIFGTSVQQRYYTGQRCMESEIFDSDSTPALAEYTPTPKHFKVLDSNSGLISICSHKLR